MRDGRIDLISESGGQYETYTGGVETAATLKASDYKGAQIVCYEVDMIAEVGSRFEAYREDAEHARPLKNPKHKGEQVVCYAIDQQGGKGGANWLKDKMCTILSDSHGTPHAVCYAADGFKGNMGAKAGNIGYVRGGCPTLVAGQETHCVICFEPGIAKREGGQTASS